MKQWNETKTNNLYRTVNTVNKKGCVIMPLPKNRTYTIEDIYSLPEDERAELIDGKIYYMAPPNTRHQRLSMHLSAQILNHIQKNNGSCEVFPAPFAVYLDESSNTYVEPDISVVCDPNKINDRGCKGAPDWIIEIISPSSRRMDYYTKLFKYRMTGVREYWIVDPDKNRILIYNFETEDTGDYTFSDTVKAGIYEDLYIDFSQLNLK